jgi:pimeloyl-ACP methyl ester carboxylesterase
MILHHELLAQSGSEPKTSAPTEAFVFLHGILGTGVNLRSLARRFVDIHGGAQALLVDLRGHGRSLGAGGADSIEQAAIDVEETARAAQVTLRGAVGHSFGGKVALALLGRAPTLEHAMTLDSSPGPRLDHRGSESMMTILDLLEQLRGPWASRVEFIAEVERAGQPKLMAQWLGMNVVQRSDGWEFGPDLPRIRALLESYFRLDHWPIIEACAKGSGGQVHLVIASRSTIYDEAERERARRIAERSSGRVTVDEVEAGHWLHVENPKDVEACLQRTRP